MTDQILPAGPFPRPQDWPYWMPDTLLGRLPMPSVPSNDVWDRVSPIESPAAMPAVSNSGLLGSLASLNDDRSSNGGLLGNLLPALSRSYLSPVPQAPSWESIATYPTAGAPQPSPELPSPTACANYGASTPEEPPPADEAAAVEDARRAAAARLARGVRGRAAAPDEPPASAANAETGEPGLIERTRLNGVDSFYRGTLMGAGRLALMQHYASTPDEPGIDPQTKRWRDQLRKDYPQVLADLARYNRMRTFENPAELAAAAIGQLGGGLPTPESLVGVGAKGATWLARLLKAGLQQGAVTAATDPAVQALNIKAGVQDGYDPWRTAAAGATGFVTGAGVKSAAEALGGGVPRHAPAAVPTDDARLHDDIGDARGGLPTAESPDAQPSRPASGALVQLDNETLPTLKSGLRAQFERALSGSPRTLDRLTIGEVSPEGAARINAALRTIGVDLDASGFRHTVDASEARHVVKKHGERATEGRRGQIAITSADWEMIPDILANPDAVSASVSKRGGLPGLLYEKRVDGHVIYIEEVRTGARTFAAKTMYKKKIAEGE
jgi:hypothetical protein